MKKKLILFSIIISSTSMLLCTSPQKKLFSIKMHTLWNTTGAWTREYLVATSNSLPNRHLALQQLLRNQEEIGTVLAPFFGQEATDMLTKLLKEHVLVITNLIQRATKKDFRAFKAANRKWRVLVQEISTLLSKKSPYIQSLSFTHTLNTYFTRTKLMIKQYVTQAWNKDGEAYNAARVQLNALAESLDHAIVNGFPESFS